jgi:hypothetical protein
MAVDNVRWFEHPNSSYYLYTPDFYMDVIMNIVCVEELLGREEVAE